jgi:hypothetical protein
MSDNWQCTLDTQVRADGVRIEGHPYKAALKVIDLDTDKEYEILCCERCGNYSVGFNGSITHSNDDAFYQVVQVGGE